MEAEPEITGSGVVLRRMDKTRLLWELTRLRDELGRANALIDSLTVRVAAQAEMLGRAAETRGESVGRLKELEAALAPFAAILINGWDTGELPPTASYPVQMGDLRCAARVLSGVRNA